MSKALSVWYGQQPVGRLLRTPGRQMAFGHDGDRLTDGWPISCSLPPTKTGDFVPPYMRGHHFFANLLPEGGARERLVRWLGTAADDFLLLERLGADYAGALQILRKANRPTTEAKPAIRWIPATCYKPLATARANGCQATTSHRACRSQAHRTNWPSEPGGKRTAGTSFCRTRARLPPT